MTGDPGELSDLDVAARLADVLMRYGQAQVAEAVHVPLIYLLDMVECKRPFNRTVLRYLGLKRKVIYLPMGRRIE